MRPYGLDKGAFTDNAGRVTGEVTHKRESLFCVWRGAAQAAGNQRTDHLSVTLHMAFLPGTTPLYSRLVFDTSVPQLVGTQKILPSVNEDY